MKIIVHDCGMVNIDTDYMCYANIRNMYTESRNGAGMQLTPELEDKRDELGEICDNISQLVYQLTDLESPQNAPSRPTNELSK
jgi:hypothetical protein